MKLLPNTENPIVLRTDFSDQARWEQIYKAIEKPFYSLPLGPFQAHVTFIDNTAYKDVTIEQVLAISKQYEHSFIVLADHQTMTSPDSLLLVVDLWNEPGRAFLTTTDQIQGIENNLSIANMDFYEFADNVDKDGIFRGFGDLLE